MSQVAILSQDDYQTFLKKVALLSGAGIEVDYTVSKPHHKKVKVVVNTPIEVEKWDRLCKEAEKC